MRYTSLFIGPAFLFISMNSLATVGGGQHIEFLGYEAKEQKLYFVIIYFLQYLKKKKICKKRKSKNKN